MSAQTTAAKNLIESVRETLKRNLVVSSKNGTLKINETTLASILSVVDLSFNDATMNNMHIYLRQLAEK